MRALKLMPDYDCFPLWEASPGQIGNVDPASLAIPASLVEDLAAWGAAYDATLDRDDPPRSGFGSATAQSAFEARGRVLQARLQAALGDGFSVSLQT